MAENTIIGEWTDLDGRRFRDVRTPEGRVCEVYPARVRQVDAVDRVQVHVRVVTTMIVDVPARFYWDHVGRDLPGGRVVKVLSRTVRVDLDREAYDDLLSDAKHYASGAMDDMYLDDFATASGLIRSARATVRALSGGGAS